MIALYRRQGCEQAQWRQAVSAAITVHASRLWMRMFVSSRVVPT
jgi:hypothetical protein